MLSILESNEYDVFDYKHADEQPMTLDEAVEKAAALRKADRNHFYRIEPVDSAMSGFRVNSVTPEEVYAETASRLRALAARLLVRYRSRLVK